MFERPARAFRVRAGFHQYQDGKGGRNGWTYFQDPVGLSNILDSELLRRKPGEWPHGKVVGATVVNSKLFCKVVKGIEAVTVIETFLILSVAALDFSVVSGRVRADELVPNTQSGSS